MALVGYVFAPHVKMSQQWKDRHNWTDSSILLHIGENRYTIIVKVPTGEERMYWNTDLMPVYESRGLEEWL